MNATADPPQTFERPIDRWFAKYSADHVDPTNQKIHYVAVPLILWSVSAVLWWLPLPDPVVRMGFRDGVWCALAMFAAWMFYYRASRTLGLGMLAVFLAMLWLNVWLHRTFGPTVLLQLAIGVFALAWIAQFVGHKIEGAKPSFFTDVIYLMIGPAWLLGKVYRRLGLKY